MQDVPWLREALGLTRPHLQEATVVTCTAQGPVASPSQHNLLLAVADLKHPHQGPGGVTSQSLLFMAGCLRGPCLALLLFAELVTDGGADFIV